MIRKEYSKMNAKKLIQEDVDSMFQVRAFDILEMEKRRVPETGDTAKT